MKTLHFSSAACGLLAGAAIMTIAVPATAQGSEELIVTGRYGRVPDNVQSLSQAVSYGDLDLSTAAGKHELKHRLSLTARFLCGKLGEADSSSPVVSSCKDAAVRDALDRAGTLEAHFAPRGTTWVSGPAWQPPYPADWASRYP